MSTCWILPNSYVLRAPGSPLCHLELNDVVTQIQHGGAWMTVGAFREIQRASPRDPGEVRAVVLRGGVERVEDLRFYRPSRLALLWRLSWKPSIARHARRTISSWI